MSQAIENEEVVDDVGRTSDEIESAKAQSWRSAWTSLSVYEVMLLISLVCITLAILLLLLELQSFGNLLSGFPWRTEEALIK